MLKLHFKYTEAVRPGGDISDDPTQQQQMFTLVVNTIIEMKEHNLIYPYLFTKVGGHKLWPPANDNEKPLEY